MTDTQQPTATTSPEAITAAATESFDQSPDARRREIMQALVRHLHGFISEVKLTPAEWMAAIEILTQTGQLCDEHRQEFILWSDTLGASMLVDALDNPLPAGATESTVLGPFYVPGAPLRENGANLAAEDDAGTPALVHGHVRDTAGRPIAGAELDIWQNGADELYAVQRPEAPEDHLRARLRTLQDGSYAFIGVRPVPYSIPHDGPVGHMLSTTGRHPHRPAHIHMIIRADGYRTVTTHIFDRASDYLDSDAVFAVKSSLVRDFVTRSPDDPDTPPGITGEWVSVENDLVLAPDR
jgi:hydroxyquinol 1,2-dioxygenase